MMNQATTPPTIFRTQAFSQAPWRLQLRGTTIFLLVLIIAGLTAAFHLGIGAQIAEASMLIQDMKGERVDVTQDIADLRTHLAFISSSAEMEKRALALGFTPYDPEKMKYIIIPGYQRPPVANLAPPPGLNVLADPFTPKKYTQSLWDWVIQDFFYRGGR